MAFEEQRSRSDGGLHRVWLAALLNEYYDSMYEFQLSQREDEVLFRGSREDVVDWAMAEGFVDR